MQRRGDLISTLLYNECDPTTNSRITMNLNDILQHLNDSVDGERTVKDGKEIQYSAYGSWTVLQSVVTTSNGIELVSVDGDFVPTNKQRINFRVFDKVEPADQTNDPVDVFVILRHDPNVAVVSTRTKKTEVFNAIKNDMQASRQKHVIEIRKRGELCQCNGPCSCGRTCKCGDVCQCGKDGMYDVYLDNNHQPELNPTYQVVTSPLA